MLSPESTHAHHRWTSYVTTQPKVIAHRTDALNHHSRRCRPKRVNFQRRPKHLDVLDGVNSLIQHWCLMELNGCFKNEVLYANVIHITITILFGHKHLSQIGLVH